jgi:hypothetical protein
MVFLRRTVQFASMSLLLVGCAPGYVAVKQADLLQLEQRLQEQGDRLQQLAFEQWSARYMAREAHQEVVRVLQDIAGQQREQVQSQEQWQDFIRSTRLRRQQQAVEGERVEAPSETFVTVASDKQVVGAVEKVFLSPPGAMMPARIDTGAATSSLDARAIERFERNSERWVRFSIVVPGEEDEITLERKVVRNVRIIQAVPDEAERRPVVELAVTVGKTTQTAQFTLSDRSNLEYPVLIGRNVLMDIMIVDVSEEHLAPARVPADANGGAGAP